MEQTPVHPDLFSADEAIRYARLDEAAETPEAARRLLHRLVQDSRVMPLRLGKRYIYARSDLDRFIASEIEKLASPQPTSQPARTAGTARQRNLTPQRARRSQEPAPHGRSPAQSSQP